MSHHRNRIDSPTRSHVSSETGKEFPEFEEVDRLGEVMVESSFKAQTDILFLPPTGLCNEKEVLSPGLLSNSLSNVVTVELGHSNIEQDSVWHELFGVTQGIGAVIQREAWSRSSRVPLFARKVRNHAV